MPNSPMSPAQWGLLLLLSILWGGSFFFSKLAVAEISPLLLVLARVAIGAAALWLVVAAQRLTFPTAPTVLARLAVMGLLNCALPFSLIFWGQTQISSGLAATLNAATPLFTALLAHAWGREETLTRSRVAGVVIGLAGVALLVGAGLQMASPLAPLACLGATMSYAVAVIFARKKLRDMPPVILATGQFCAAVLILLPVLLILPLPSSLSAATVGAIAGLGLLSTAFAYLVFFRLLATAGATNVQLVTFLIPVSAILLGVAFLDESLTARHLIGMGVIATGLILLDGRLLRRTT